MSTTPNAPIRVTDVQTALNGGISTNYPGGTSRLTFNDYLVRTLAGRPSGSISMNDMRNKEGPLPYGTLVSQFCGGGYTLNQTFADGRYGTYAGTPIANSPTCGYVAITYVQYILVGGGGGGGLGMSDSYGGGGGGGGGGGLYMNDVNLSPGMSFAVTIGQGGAAGYFDYSLWACIKAQAGGSTRISGVAGTFEAGGGQPGLGRYYWDGSQNVQHRLDVHPESVYHGGAGGNGRYTPYGLSSPYYLGPNNGLILDGPGNPGGQCYYQGRPGESDGKRAGGGGAGSDNSDAPAGGDGGRWVDGYYYGGGGAGGSDSGVPGSGGFPGGGRGGGPGGYTPAGNGSPNTGGGGGGGGGPGGGSGGSGGSGMVRLRYPGTTVRASGGRIVQGGGTSVFDPPYIYHFFSENGTFTML